MSELPYKRLITVALSAVVALGLAGCHGGEDTSYRDPDYGGQPDPGYGGQPFRYDGPDSNGNGRWDPSPLDPHQS